MVLIDSRPSFPSPQERSPMRLMRFDPTGVVDDTFGITREQVETFNESLTVLRSELFDPTAARYHGGLRLPEKLLTDYEATREKSELGRVFRVANRLHDHLDAVAVIGREDILHGPAALMRACCEPYHNELTRSARGSKPRMYFVAADFDNDVIDGLRRRLAVGGDDRHAAERRYAVIAIDASGDDPKSSLATSVSTALISDQLAMSLGDAATRWMPKLMIPIAPASGPVRTLANTYNCPHDFEFGKELGGPLGIYSPASLLPAALLGLNCIEFLVGAAEINEHFLNASFSDNVVMQFVATQFAMEKFRGLRSSQLQIWNPALVGFAACWQRLLHTSPGGHVMPMGHGVIHHLSIDTVRSDPLPIGAREVAGEFAEAFSLAPQRDGQSVAPTLPDLAQAMIAKSKVDQRLARQPATHLMLPYLDMHSLGQLLQFTCLVGECFKIGTGGYDLHS